MFYAHDATRKKITALPALQGFCPGCGEQLIPKCGEIVSWHWSHRADDCDPWYEPETEWHRWWKRQIDPSRCEVVMENHRADMVGRNGLVIELQHGSLSPEEARERERFYRNRGLLVWLFNGATFLDNVSFRDSDAGTYETFRWRWPRKTHWLLRSPLYWDMGDGWLFRVQKVHSQTPCGGWGYRISDEAFIQKYIGPYHTERQ